MTEPTPDRIVVACPCGAKLRVAATSVGKKAKCPKCGEAFRITAPGTKGTTATARQPAAPTRMPAAPVKKPTPTPTRVSTPQPSPPKDDADDFLNELGLQEGVAAPAVTGDACQGCGKALGVGMRVCPNCGHDSRKTRPAPSATLPEAPKAAEPAKVKPAHSGSFLRGCGFSLIGASIGAGIWAGIAYAINAEIGYVAWGVGILAGIGMAMGAKRKSAEAGGAAAFIAVAGILLGKALTAFIFAQAYAPDDSQFPILRRTIVWQHQTLAALEGRDVKPTPEAWDAALTDTELQAGLLSEEEVNEEWFALRAAAEEARLTRKPAPGASHPFHQYTLPIEFGDAPPPARTSGQFFSAMFGLYDLLWFFLALSSAFRIASNQGDREAERQRALGH